MADKSAVTRVAPMQPDTLHDRPWKKLGIDFVGPDYSAPDAERYTIFLIDYRSKWPEIAFASDITVKTVISFLTIVFSREGYPEEIVSYNGPQLISHEFEEFFRINIYYSSLFL